MDGQGLDFLAGLRNALGKECPECGEMNPSSVDYCEVCGAVMPLDEEEESFSIVHAEGVAGGAEEIIPPKELIFIELNRQSNLEFLQDTINLARGGNMTFVEYQDRIKKVLNVAKAGYDKFSKPSRLKEAEALPEVTRNIYMRMMTYFEEYIKGCQRMLDYDGGGDGTPAMEGILTAERALNNLEKMQKKADKLLQ